MGDFATTDEYAVGRGDVVRRTLAPTPGANETAARNCQAQFEFDYDIPILVVCVVAFLIGLVYTFFGYRLFKVVLFLTGLIFGCVLIYLVCDKEHLLSPLGNAGVALGAGVLFGVITTLVEYVGIFMTGFLSGFFVGIVAMLVLAAVSPPTTLWVTIGVIFGTGLVFALLTLTWQRAFLLLGTALMGGVLMASSLNYFLERFFTVTWIWHILNVRPTDSSSLCWYSWLNLGLWPAIFLIGSLIQWRITSVGYTHSPGYGRIIRKRPTNSQQAHKESSASARTKERSRPASQTGNGPRPVISTMNEHTCKSQPKSFKQIYQIRRAHGDVICQGYMESLQRLQQQNLQREQSTLNSDQTRLTVISSSSQDPPDV